MPNNGKAKNDDIPKLPQQFETDRQFLNLILAMLDKIKISVKTHPESDRQREANEIAPFKNRLLTLKR